MHDSARRHKQRRKRRKKQREHLWIGILLMGIGVVFLLHQFYVIDLVMPRSWYFAIPIAFGVIRMLSSGSAEGVGSGALWVFGGLWAWACMEHWHGLSWSNSWPIALAAVGLSMVIKSLPSLLPERHEDDESSAGNEGSRPTPRDAAEGSRNHA
jgi:hypothetical protein